MNTFAIHTDMNVLASNGLIAGLHRLFTLNDMKKNKVVDMYVQM